MKERERKDRHRDRQKHIKRQTDRKRECERHAVRDGSKREKETERDRQL